MLVAFVTLVLSQTSTDAPQLRQGSVFQRQRTTPLRLRQLFQVGGKTISLTVDGVTRTGLVFAPESASKTPSPLVFGWHGHGGGSRQASMSFHIHTEWPEAVVVYPQGLPSKGKTDPEGKKPGWQQGPNDGEGRDLKFFDALLAQIEKDYKIDKRRIFSMGHSNGGRFTYLLWSERGDVFAAFGPSGSPAIGLAYKMKAKPFFHVAGEQDPLVPYSGQKVTIEQLKGLDGIKQGDAGKKDGYLTSFTGKNGLEVQTYVHPGGHAYPREVPKLLVEFFKRQSK